MLQRLRIDHRPRYEFAQPVSLSPHFVRLFARTEPGRLVQRQDFATNPSSRPQFRRDRFDNVFARCFYPELEGTLFFDSTLELELHEQNPFDFLLEYDAANHPFQYSLEDAFRLAPYLNFSDAIHFGTDPHVRLLPLPFWSAPAELTPTVTLLAGLVEALHKNLGYERRDEGTAYSPAETLRLGHGACRDVSVLFAAIARELGLASRIVSGYLCEFGQEATNRRAEGSMHMWTEIYLPGAGWTGLDATNGVFCDHKFIAAAAGLTTAEVTPISGRYFSKEPVESHMTASIELTAL